MAREMRMGILLVVCVVGMLCPLAWGRYGGGSGTDLDPYLIYTAEHLRQVGVYRSDWRDDVCYKLMADIDLAEFDQPIEPIGTMAMPFMGDFDGNGKTISNLKISQDSGDNVGLFGYTTANIRDLGLIDVEILAPKSTGVGGIAGWMFGEILRCYVRGGSVCGGDEVGGLVGYYWGPASQCYTTCKVSGRNKVGGLLGSCAEWQTVSQCYSAAIVLGTRDVGGLVGVCRGILKDCYATSGVSAEMFVGGLVGNGSGDGQIWNCYAAGRLSGKSVVGGVCASDATCYSSFWDAQVGGPTSMPSGVGKTTAEMRTAATFRSWGREGAWTIEEGRDYPRLAWESRPGEPLTTAAFPDDRGKGTAQDPYRIRTAAELDEIGDFPGEWDKHYRLESDIDMASLKTLFHVIGCRYMQFTGVFDGGGHSISNFVCPYRDYGVGLFGWIRGATVRGVTMVNPRTLSGWISMGTLVGQQVEGTVEDCGVEGGHVSGRVFAGGLIGRCSSGTVTRCYSTCEVTSGNSREDIGGLIGTGERCNINNCYARAVVDGPKNVGGLIGRMDAGNVSHCYSVGPVTGAENVGGLIGLTAKTIVTACFWDTQSSGQGTSAGGTGLETVDLQMATTFVKVGWDFAGEQKNGTAEIWSIDEGKDYPRFFEGPVVPPERVWADDFEDGTPEPLWQVYEPTPGIARIREINGRLELDVPKAPADRVSAACLSRGWAVDGSQDFSLRVDFHFILLAMGEGWVSIGLAPSPATPIGQRLEWTAGCLDNEPIHESERADGLGFATSWTARGSDSGTLYLSYDAAADELYLSYIGYGPANAWRTMTGLLKDRWAGGPVYVVLAGGSDGMEIKPGEAWLDNFAVDTGTILE